MKKLLMALATIAAMTFGAYAADWTVTGHGIYWWHYGSDVDPGCCMSWEVDEILTGPEGSIVTQPCDALCVIYRNDVAIAEVWASKDHEMQYFTDYDVVPGSNYTYWVSAYGKSTEPVTISCHFLCQADIGAKSVLFDADGGSEKVAVSVQKITATSSSFAYMDNPICSTNWLTAEIGGDWRSVIISAEPNDADSAREGVVTISCLGTKWQISVKQEAKQKKYMVEFDANGGEGGWSSNMVYGAAIVAPTVTRDGYTFAGWNPAVAATVPASNVMFTAVWTEIPPPEPTMWTVAFDANGGALGTTRPAVVVTNGCAIGELPLATREGYTFDGWFTAADAGSRVSDDIAITANVTLYAHWTAVTPDPDPIPQPTPVPDPTPTPTPTPGAIVSGEVLDAAFAKAQIVNGALYKGNALVGTVQVKIGKINKKGLVKVSATATMLIDGKAKKVSAKAVSIDARRVADNAPYQIVFKAPIGEMAFEMAADGKFTLKNNSYVMVEAEVGGALKSGSRGTFRLYGLDLAAPGEMQEELLPHEETFEVAGTKWKFDKAASVKWAKPKKGAALPEIYDEASGKGLVIDDANGKTNLSGLKLTYTAKTGQFKGSFKAYALEEANGKTKLKKYTVNVIGFVVGGKGVGEARCKKPAAGPWAVTVE